MSGTPASGGRSGGTRAAEDLARQDSSGAIMLALRREIISIAKVQLGLAQDDLIAKAARSKMLMMVMEQGQFGTSSKQQRELANQVDWKNDTLVARQQQEDQDELDEDPVIEEELDIGTLLGVEATVGDPPAIGVPPGRTPSPNHVSPAKVHTTPGKGIESGGTGGGWLSGGVGWAAGTPQSTEPLERRMAEQMAMMQKILEGQASLKKELAAQRAESQMVVNNVRSLQTWIINDRLTVAKLQA